MPQDAGQPRRVTMRDVAKLAGVSQPTVSFVLNDRRDVAVAEGTRHRVLEAAAHLDFRPNRAAQSLRSNRSYTIGVITNGIVSQPYAGRIVQGIQNTVQPADYVCMVIDTTDDPAEGDSAVANLLAQGVAAIVYASPFPRPIHTSRRLAGTRTLCVNCWPEAGGTAETVIVADEYAGGRAAAAAVFERGHRDAAFVGGRADDYARGERRRGFRDAAQAVGLDPEVLIQVDGVYSIGSGYELTRQIFADRSPTALVCGNDRMATGALLALHSLGLECPGDVSIVGFDDQPDVADQVHPALTTVALPHLQMGVTAGRLLLDPPADSHERVVLPCPLVERESLGPPPGHPSRGTQASRRAAKPGVQGASTGALIPSVSSTGP